MKTETSYKENLQVLDALAELYVPMLLLNRASSCLTICTIIASEAKSRPREIFHITKLPLY
jgi:hypothetical protein